MIKLKIYYTGFQMEVQINLNQTKNPTIDCCLNNYKCDLNKPNLLIEKLLASFLGYLKL